MDLTLYRQKLIQDVASNKNRIIRILEDCNVKLSSVVSDTGGVTATKLIDKLCDGKTVTMDDIDEVYTKKIEASKEEIFEACNDYMTDHYIYLLVTIREHNHHIKSLILDLDIKIRDILAPYDNALERLREISGLNCKSIEGPIAEIGLDMKVLPSGKNRCSWVGISPGNNESAGKKKVVEQPTGTNRPKQS